MTADDSGQPEVLISDRQDLAVDEAELVELARSCLAREGAAESELSVSLVSLEEMAELHARYMGEEGPTDVLSFPQDQDQDQDQDRADDERDGDGGRRLLGDVVICPAFAGRNNADLGSELRLLLVHGILHLLGYDHEEDRERAVMWARQERYTGVAV